MSELQAPAYLRRQVDGLLQGQAVESLVGLSSEKAGHLYGVVYPRYNWFLRAAFRVFNVLLWMRRSQFRVFVHPTDKVEDLVRGNGLERRFYARTAIWQVAVFAR